MKRLIASHLPSMKNAAFLVTALAAVLVCGSAHAQEAADEENLEYEKLKVLEPMVGTYSFEWSNAETEAKWESLMTISWSSSKKMLVAESKVRGAEAGEDISKQSWEPGIRHFYIWNHISKRIEMIDVQALTGVVYVSEVKPEKTGVFTYLPVSSTATRKDKADMMVIATDRDITLKLTNRVDVDGESIEDVEYTALRLKE